MNLNRLVLGTVGIGGIWGPVDAAESVQTIIAALEAGISAIDTAPAYGDAESYVGLALKEWKGPTPVISSKVGRLKGFSATAGVYDYSEQAMTRSVEQTLETLGIDSLDILFLHDPAHMDPKDAGTVLKTMAGFKEKKYARKIGLGGNPPAWFKPYLTPDLFDVLMEFNTLNACNTDALDKNLPYCFKNGIQYYAASPLYMGLLGNRYEAFTASPPAWISGETVTRAKKLECIAKANGLTLPALAHRFLLSLPFAFNIVIGAVNRSQLLETIADITCGRLDERMVNEIMNTSK